MICVGMPQRVGSFEFEVFRAAVLTARTPFRMTGIFWRGLADLKFGRCIRPKRLADACAMGRVFWFVIRSGGRSWGLIGRRGGLGCSRLRGRLGEGGLGQLLM